MDCGNESNNPKAQNAYVPEKLRYLHERKALERTLIRTGGRHIAFFLEGQRSTLRKISDIMVRNDNMMYMLDYVLDDAGTPMEIRCDRLV